MAPLTPTWAQPSHPDVQQVIINEADFTSKSLSRRAVAPFGLFAKMDFPPCTVAEDGATYATVQFARDAHLNLNSDLLYINHSCEPSLIFDTANFTILAGPKGLHPGDELTFFYPSTEWEMAQPFDCNCGTPSCRGRISGAKDMKAAELQGTWLNGHIRAMLEGREATLSGNGTCANRQQQPGDGSLAKGTSRAAHAHADDPTAQALRDALLHAEKVVEAARLALVSYRGTGGARRHGPTSRELSGEMAGDTVRV